MKAVILARVSTEMQEDGFSLDAQLDRLRNYCSLKDLEIAKEFTFVESSFHGKRTKFYEAVNYIKRQSKLTALVVDTVDRLQRTFNEFPMLLELVKKEKLALHFFKEGLVIDKNFKSSDLAMWQMQILSANMFVNSTRDNVKRSEERMLNEGLLPGPAPIGYLNTKDENGKKTIIIDPDRGHFIKKLFEEYSTGLFSMDELVKKSKNWGLRNRKSGNPITKAQFADILQNPFYYGVMYYNKSYFPHIYEKLISKELFDKCTEVRTGKFKRTSKHTKEPYIFRGLVRCKHCGCLLSPYTKKGQYVYLRHTDLKNCEHCNNVSEKILLKEVEKALASISFDDELKLALADELKKRYEALHGNNYYQLEKNRNQLADVEENQKKLLDLLIAGTVSAEVYRSKNAEYETVKIELQAKIEQLQTPDNSVERAIDKVLNFSQNSFAIFKSSQIEEKRRILNIVFANFLMDGKNPEISMHKNFKLLSKIGACEDWCADLDLNFKGEDDKTRCNSMGYFQEACQGNKSPLLKCPYNSAYFKCTCDTSIYRYSALNCPPGSYPDEDVCDDYSKGCVCENNKIWSAEDNSCVGCLSDNDCADGKECNNRECVNIDLCAGVNCTGGQSCNSETGVCECPSGEVFYNNRCEAPSCTNKEIQCSGSTSVCAANGQCVECVSASDCGANEICSGNTCQTVDRCKDVSCSGGKSCNPNNGQCECPSDKPYESGDVCESPNCANGGVTCPSGQTCNKTTKVCEDSARIIPCKVGDTLYSDIHCYDGIPAGKKAIATVFDTQKGLAAALTRKELKWFNGSTDMTKTDVSQLENCSSSVDKTKCSTDGKSNTIKIINHAGSSKSSYEAANYCYSYTTEGTKAGDWFLPSAAEMDKIITSIDALGQYWDSYWTSIELNGVYAWQIGENSVGGVPQGKSYISSSQKNFKNYVRPVIAYNDLTPVEPDCTNGGIICAADEKCNETTGKCETDYAEILYSDKTTSINLIPGKTAIGIVVDSSRRLAVALAYEDRQWESADNVDVLNGKTKLTNLSALADIDSGNTKTSFSGKTNTQTIVNNCGKCLAAKYANEYVTSGTKAGDWYLPASGELWLMYQRKAAINRTLSKLGKSTVLTSGSYAWSSSESSYTHAGNGSVRIPTAWGIRTTGEIGHISKHLYHKVYPMITY